MKSKKNDISALNIFENQTIGTFEFPIVGIGASAGGLEALEEFFENMPNNCGMAFVVIQHLDPKHVSLLPELLQRKTQMNVVEITNHLKITMNQVFVIPPNKVLSILNGYLYLFEKIKIDDLRLPIDYFFQTLAQDQQELSIGVILSGMGSDGSLGLKAIKENNGTVLVQDPSTAKFKSMPEHATNAVIADIVAAPKELPAKLISLLKITPKGILKQEILEESKTYLNKIIQLLKTQTGHDFFLYKKSTLFRRIERRMHIHQFTKILLYYRFLLENPKEVDILFKELLIGVTNFFRDVNVWDKIKETVLPSLFMDLPDETVIRAWIAGCSTGEEAYSLAIIFQEVYQKLEPKKTLKLQIFATDINIDAIDSARKGMFGNNIVEDVLPERINQFFTKVENGFRINAAIREMVIFTQHNVIKDPPFTKLDILICRNFLIYLEPELQKKIMNLFHYSLKPNGIMVLGSAETENGQYNQFLLLDSKLKIYKKNAIPPIIGVIDFPSSFVRTKKQAEIENKTIKFVENIQTLTDQLLLQQFAPASVLINADGDVLYITGRTGKYLEPAAGKGNWNIYSMAREGLRNELPAAIRKAKQSFEIIKLHNLKVGTNGGTQFIDLTIQSIEKPEALKGTIIILFTDLESSSKQIITKIKNDPQILSNRESELESELQQAKEELEIIRTDMQNIREKLQLSNEEMHSTNEELQSTNEELTTSKEELQSLNEELQTVNDELESKISEFLIAKNDINNLLNSTDIATLFLDKHLNIRRFTDSLIKIFKIRESDIGRPFTDMVTDLQYPSLSDDAKQVLGNLMIKEMDINTNDQRWFKVRLIPYRTFDDNIDGLVITFIDISKAKLLETQLALINNNERGKRASDLIIANKEVLIQFQEKEKIIEELNRAIELLKANNLYKPKE